MEPLPVKQDGHILHATVNRPDSRNAINFDVMDAMESVLDRLEKEENIRAFILRGAGGHFISGGDLKEFHTLKSAEEAKPMARRMLSILQRLEQLPCWTIACINGAAYGGGCETMLAFDFRIATPSATFGFTQAKFYLPPGWGGLTRLVERVGRSTALRWLGEAAIIDAETALHHKLIDRLAGEKSLEEETLQWAGELCRNDRRFIGNLKEGAMRLAKARWKAIQEELDSFAHFWEHPKHEERVQKFIDRASG